MNDPAARVRELFGRDRYAARLGMQLIDDDPHHIVVDMPVTQDHENFFDILQTVIDGRQRAWQ